MPLRAPRRRWRSGVEPRYRDRHASRHAGFRWRAASRVTRRDEPRERIDARTPNRGEDTASRVARTFACGAGIQVVTCDPLRS